MKKVFSILTIVLISIYVIFFTGLLKEEVKVLEQFDFEEGNWKLVKGYYGDSIQYIITDKDILNKLKEDWILYKSERNFATTGGYNIELYKDSNRVLLMDIINDGWLSKQTSGILGSDIGGLWYPNLHWLDNYSEHWVEEKTK